MTVTLRAARALLLASLCTMSLPSLADPTPNTWSPTGSLSAPRDQHTLTLLDSGQALIAGGCTDFFCNTPSGLSDTYDPASGSWTPAGNMVQNRTAHTATLLANGQVLVAGGCSDTFGCPGITSAELYNPTTRQWTATGALHIPRSAHTATRLADGRVLVAGGIGRCDSQVCNALSSAEIYSPQTGQWSAAASMPSRRVGQAAVLLQDGRVLLVGGCSEPGLPCGTLGDILYDPAQDIWTSTGMPVVARTLGLATLLGDGSVVVASGVNAQSFEELTIERYDPATNAWSQAGSLHDFRFDATANLLSTGQILYAGGGTSSAELYDPPTAVSSPTDSMSSSRQSFAAVTLLTDDVLAVGGQTVSDDVLSSAELYRPGSSPLVGLNHSSIDFGLLEQGDVSPPSFVVVTNTGSSTLVIDSVTTSGNNPDSFTRSLLCPGGIVAPGDTCRISVRFIATGLRARSAQLDINDNAPDSPQHVALSGFTFVVAPNHWAPGGNMSEGRDDHTSTSLADGRVLVAGGSAGASADVYDSTNGTWQATGPMTATRHGHTADLLLDGHVLVAGGGRSTAELYNPASNTWSATGDLDQVRKDAASARLPDGRVLVTGGCSGNACTAAELYDPASGTFSDAQPMNTARTRHTATALQDGRILVAGGGTAAAELYDPASGTWTPTGSLHTTRSQHTATLLTNGRVLVTGGCDGDPCRAAEIYNPATGRWARAQNMRTPHVRHAATALADGRVLVEGGTYFCDPEFGFCFTTSEAEVYSPDSDTWSRTGSMILRREIHAASLLPDGRVLVTGGNNDEVIAPFNSTEIFTP